MEMHEENKKILNGKDIKKSWFLWWFSCEVSNSFERLQSLSFCISMIPILKKLYKKKEDLSMALKRHLQFFNTQCIWGGIVPGITIAMEEQKALGKDVPEEAITGIKAGLMGPFAGIGDTIDWATWFPIIIGFFIPLAKSGSWIGGVAPIVIFAIIGIIEGYTIYNIGYKAGTNSATQMLESGWIQQLIIGASILGLFMMGGLAASYVIVSTPIFITTDTAKISLQTDILDKILPGILQLLVVGGVYMYLEKIKRNYTNAMVLILVVGLVLGSLGIL